MYKRQDIISFHAKFKLDIARSFGIMSDEEAVNFQKQRRMLNENNWYYWRDVYKRQDLGPASKGHALILPKAHAANIYEISDDMAAKAMILAKKMATKMTEALKCDGFNIVQNNGEPAGQTVFHFHMHLIPSCLLYTSRCV